MVPEAPPKQTEDGLVAVGGGWFVLNAREARWNSRPGRQGLTFTGSEDWEADTYFLVLAMSSRENQAFGPYGAYTVDEAARRHRACSEEETQDGDVAYANVPDSEPTRYRDGWLP